MKAFRIRVPTILVYSLFQGRGGSPLFCHTGTNEGVKKYGLISIEIDQGCLDLVKFDLSVDEREQTTFHMFVNIQSQGSWINSVISNSVEKPIWTRKSGQNSLLISRNSGTSSILCNYLFMLTILGLSKNGWFKT